MKKLIIFSLLLFTTLVLQAQNDNYKKAIETGYKDGVIKDLKAIKKALSFCVIGDWGRYGAFYQKAVAEQMSNAIVGVDATMIVSTGDNFYPKGVKSEYDPIWQQSFENVYTSLPLHEDWFVSLGNHDYKTNPDAEVAYSKLSARWHMPARYFNFVKKINGDSTKTVEFFFIDSSPFQSEYYTNDEYVNNVKTADTSAQKKWLEEALKNSKATWKLVVGHHPLYSAGKRKGKTQDMQNAFEALFNKYKVDAYFCGHEHHLEYDEPESVSFKQFISGAGSEATAVSSATYAKFVQQEFGFLTASITGKEMLVQFVSWEGKILYTTTITK
jgi:hypothetical protein